MQVFLPKVQDNHIAILRIIRKKVLTLQLQSMRLPNLKEFCDLDPDILRRFSVC